MLSLLIAGCASTQARPAAVPSSGPTASESVTAPPAPTPSPTPATLSLDDIFGSPKNLRGVDASRVVTLIVTGDVIPGRNVNVAMVRRNDFLWPFRATVDYLHSGDIEFINLESPLVLGCPVRATGMSFCGDPRFINGLAYAGVNVANLANNHLTNYGPSGTNSTVKLLADHGIQPSGLGFVAHISVKGVRFAFLGFNGVGGAINRAEMQRQVADARSGADVTVVQFHWGKEYVLYPQSTNDSIAPDDPKQVGRLAVDAGADLVIGNHPHAVQGVEIYRGKLITYAHGNFVFDQMWTPDPGQEDPRNGVVGRYTFVDGRLFAVSYRPIRIYEYGQPRFVGNAYGDYVIGLMRLSSEMLAGQVPAGPPPSPPPGVAPPA